jgi:hypothetical protein
VSAAGRWKDWWSNMVVRGLMSVALAVIMLAGALPPAMADGTVTGPTLIEDFTMQPETRWRFFTDQVMGGVATGSVAFTQEDGTSFARMTGHVSNASRGGFIQMRLDLAGPPPTGTTVVLLIARGNAQRYFVHLRTDGTLLPWQYYQAGFDVTESWTEVRLPLDVRITEMRKMRSKPPVCCCAACPPLTA